MQKIKILIIVGVFYIINPYILSAQRSYDSKIFFGGNFGIQFGSITLIDASPLVGYRLTEKIDIGAGITYKYYKYKDYFSYSQGGTSYDLVSNIYGGSVFGRYHFTENFFGHIEFEYLNYSFTDYYIYSTSVFSQKKTVDISSVFVGGGYRQKMAENTYLTFTLLYNLNETKYSPYSNPIIRIGFTYGF